MNILIVWKVGYFLMPFTLADKTIRQQLFTTQEARMKRFFSLAVSIFVVLFSQSCSPSSKTANPNEDLVGTNQALSMQATIQQGIIGTQSAMIQGSGSSPTKSSTPLLPSGSSTAIATIETTGPVLLASGTGESDFTLSKYLPIYNLHVVIDNGSWPGIDSIILRNIAIKDWATGDGVIGERWFAITTPLPVGKHTVKSGGGAQWEIWSVGTPPISFSVHSTGRTLSAGIADYFFQINQQGVYQIKMDVLSGGFVVYIGCGYTGINQNVRDLVMFTQSVIQSGNYETNLNPGICFLEVATSYNSNNPQWKISVEDTGK